MALYTTAILLVTIPHKLVTSEHLIKTHSLYTYTIKFDIMKNYIGLFLNWIISLIIILSFYGCSIGGLLIGSIADANNSNSHDEALQSGEGWIQPENNDLQVKLILNNGAALEGNFIDEEIITAEGSSKEVILFNTKGKIKKIPTDMIAYTSLFPKKKNSSQTGFFIGLGIDIIIFAALYDSYSFDIPLMSTPK